jgi:carbonic anhydrase
MQKLVQGVHKFQNEIVKTEKDFFQKLALGQGPEVLFITCSDSRINPNLLTQTQPGDLFVIRNAGNIVPPHGPFMTGGEAATLEFAVAGLGVKDIVVCGHSHCGAMKALMNPEITDDLPAMREWLKLATPTKRIMCDHYSHLQGQEQLTATVEENVLMQLENLKTHPTVASKLSRGQIRLHGWVYKIETGEVFQYNRESEQFEPLTQVRTTIKSSDVTI